MKISRLVFWAAAAVLLGGCVVTSVSPYYTRKDLVFEPALLGNWIDQQKTTDVWRFERSQDLAFRFTLIESRNATVMEARTFTLQGQLFLDIVSLEQDIHVIPAHYLLKISRLAPSLRMSELNHEWLSELLDKEPALLRHHFIKTGEGPADRRLVLTASTAELQQFVLSHLKTDEAWKQSFELRREGALLLTAQPKGL